MSPRPDKRPVILIVGPTGVGKTSLSIELAKQINGEIISADSRYLYRGMNIGTAKPTEQELKSVRHHMINVTEPDKTWSLPQFLEETLQLIAEIHGRGSIPVIVGGTGQYIRALTEGWRMPEFEPNTRLRSILTAWGKEIGALDLHRKLAINDAEAANFIDPTNMRRTIRALEVIFSTGKRFSELRTKEGPAHNYWIIGLTMERPKLYQLVDKRIDAMISQGLLDEVKALLSRGYDANLPAMSAIGYREMIQHIHGEIDIEYAKALMRKNTRQLIRRQANWFKQTDPSINWYEADPEIGDRIINDLLTAGIVGGSYE